MPVQVVTDSVASIPSDLLLEHGIEVVTLYVNDGERHQADIDVDLDDFYRRLADLDHIPTSSQPSVESLVETFGAAVRRGCDVLGVFISERMSGTIEGARLAADMVRSDVPDARIEIVDSRSNSMQEGYAAIAAAKAAQAGETIERCMEEAITVTKRTRYLFTPHTLEYLKRGGRIGTAGALVGTLLQVRPILTVEDGETATFAKVRTRGKALAEMARRFSHDIRDHGLSDVLVHYIADKETAAQWAQDVIEPIVGRAVRVHPVSPVIGVHVGPAVAIVYQAERELRP